MAGPARPPTPPASETPPKTAPATEFSVAVLLMVAKGLALKVIPVKRGYYEVEFVPMFDNMEGVKDYEIMETYHKHLEEMIRENPEYWLWTHNRWKHKKEDYYRLLEKREGK